MKKVLKSIIYVLMLSILLTVVTACENTISFKINFEANGGTPVESISTEGNKNIEMPADPTKADYIFDGWFWDNGVWDKPFTANSLLNEPIKSDMTVYAKWAPAICQVTFRVDGAEDVVKEVAYGAALEAIPTAPEKLGYDVAWSVTDFSKVKGDMVVTPIYTKKNFELTVNGETKQQEFDSAVTITAPVKENKNFSRWVLTGLTETESANSTFTFKMPASAVTAVAEYVPAKVKITFNTQNGSDVASQSIDIGGKATKPEDPVKSNKVFIAWYTSLQFTTKYDFEAPVQEDITLYAKFTDLFVVTFDANGGSEIDPIEVVSGGFLTKPTDPIKTGHTFSGWYAEDTEIEDNKWNFIKDPFFKSMTLIAKWTVNSYAVSFDINGATGAAPTAKDVVFNTAYGFTAPEATKKGYAFKGWSLSNDGEILAENATLITPNDHTLYAIWKAKTFKITFNSNGGSEIIEKSVIFDGAFGELANSEKTGYNFGGWTLESALVTADTIMATDADITLTAVWTVVEYNITYINADNLTNTNATTYNIETETISLIDLVKEGYTFNGFFTDEAFTTQITEIAKGSTGEKTLYAKFTVQRFTITYENLLGADNAANAADFAYDEETELLAISRPGYTFEGFFAESDYQNIITKVQLSTARNVTVYAKWTINNYTITYENIRGGVNENAVAYNVESETIVLQTLNFDDYDFGGYFTDAAFTTAIKEIVKGSTGDLVVFVKLTPKITYTIRYGYMSDADNSKNPTTYTIDDEIIFEAPIREGYIFNGFYKGETQILKIEKGTRGNLSINAEWTIIELKIEIRDTDEKVLRTEKINYGSGIYLNQIAPEMAFGSDFGDKYFSDRACTGERSDWLGNVKADVVIYVKVVKTPMLGLSLIENGVETLVERVILGGYSGNCAIGGYIQRYQSAGNYDWFYDIERTQAVDINSDLYGTLIVYGKEKPTINVTLVFDGKTETASLYQGVNEIGNHPFYNRDYAWYTDIAMTELYLKHLPLTSDITFYGKQMEKVDVGINREWFSVPKGMTYKEFCEKVIPVGVDCCIDSELTTLIEDSFIFTESIDLYLYLRVTLTFVKDDGAEEIKYANADDIPWRLNWFNEYVDRYDCFADAEFTQKFDKNKKFGCHQTIYLGSPSFLITYLNINGGNIEKRVVREMYRENQSYEGLLNLNNYDFFTDEQGINRLDIKSCPTPEVHIYGIRKNPFTVNFDINGVLTTVTYDRSEQKKKELPIPDTIEGKVFIGYFAGDNFNNKSCLTVQQLLQNFHADVTLYAKYVDIQDNTGKPFVGAWSTTDHHDSDFYYFRADGTYLIKNDKERELLQGNYMLVSANGENKLVGAFGEIKLDRTLTPRLIRINNKTVITIRDNGEVTIDSPDANGIFDGYKRYKTYYLDAEFTQKYDHSTVLTEDITILYFRTEFTIEAHYTENDIEVVKKIVVFEGNISWNQFMTENNLNNYKWFNGENVRLDMSSRLDGACSVYGVLPKPIINITLDSKTNGGITENSVVTFNRTAEPTTDKLPTDIVKDGCLFVGWNSLSDGSGMYFDYYSACDYLIGDTTLYAIFEPVYDHTNAAYIGLWEDYGNNHMRLNADGTFYLSNGQSGFYRVITDTWGDQALKDYRGKELCRLTSEKTPYGRSKVEGGFIVSYIANGNLQQAMIGTTITVDPTIYSELKYYRWYTDPLFKTKFVYTEGNVLEKDTIIYGRYEWKIDIKTDETAPIESFVMVDNFDEKLWDKKLADIANMKKEGYLLAGFIYKSNSGSSEEFYPDLSFLPRPYQGNSFEISITVVWDIVKDYSAEPIVGIYVGRLAFGGEENIYWFSFNANGSVQICVQGVTVTRNYEKTAEKTYSILHLPNGLLEIVTVNDDGSFTYEVKQGGQGFTKIFKKLETNSNLQPGEYTCLMPDGYGETTPMAATLNENGLLTLSQGNSKFSLAIFTETVEGVTKSYAQTDIISEITISEQGFMFKSGGGDVVFIKTITA